MLNTNTIKTQLFLAVRKILMPLMKLMPLDFSGKNIET